MAATRTELVFRPLQNDSGAIDLQHVFLDAPFTEGGWDHALRSLASATGSARAHLLGIGRTATLFNHLPDIEDSYFEEFTEIAGWRPDVNWRVAVSGRPLQVLNERDYDQARERHFSDAYEAHVRHWDALYGCQTSLVQNDDLLIGLAALRSEKDGRTSRRDRDIFSTGARYALAAVRMQHAMANRGAEMATDAFQALDIAAFLLARDGTIVSLSAAADALLSRQDDRLLTIRNGRLGATHREADRRLQAALSDALTPQPDGAAMGEVWLGSSRAPLKDSLCEIFRLPRREWSFGFDPRVLVIVRAPSDIPARRVAALKAALGLTAAEAEIALRLANGEDRDEIAMRRGTGAETMKSQIKSLLRKSDTNREAQLVSLINRLLR